MKAKICELRFKDVGEKVYCYTRIDNEDLTVAVVAAPFLEDQESNKEFVAFCTSIVARMLRSMGKPVTVMNSEECN